MAISFKKATKTAARGRIALCGPSGSGKTFTALRIARGLAGPTGRIAVIDSERGSASKYADQFTFDACDLASFSPDTYVEAIRAAEAAGYDVLVIDSLSHAWMGKDGALEQVDRRAKQSRTGNSYTAWRDVTPMHNAMVDAILQSRCHVIATMRTKTEYVLETNDRGKQVPRKVGMAPIQRDGMEYEFDVVGDMTLDNELAITKTRAPFLTGTLLRKPGEELGQQLAAWLSDGATAPAPVTPAPVQAQARTAPQATDDGMPRRRGAAPSEPAPVAATEADVAEVFDTPPPPEGARISESQRKRIFALAKESGRTHDEVKGWLGDRGITSTTEVPVTLYDALCAWITGDVEPGAEESAA